MGIKRLSNVDRMRKFREKWDDAREIEFIHNLQPLCPGMPRLDILIRYKTSLKLRRDWGGMSPALIFQAIDHEIEHEKVYPTPIKRN